MESLKILLVDDNLDHQDLVAWSLKEHFTNVELLIAELGNECLRYCEEIKFDLILLDYHLPDIDGIIVLDSLVKKGYDIPVIIITGMGNEKVAVEAMRLGAYDYIGKTGNYYETLPVVVQKNIEKHNTRKEKEKLQRLLEEKNILLERLSVTDGLTGLYNHRYFYEKLVSELKRSQRYGLSFSCLLLDLDFLKNINDKWGHLIGDFVLKETANRIKEDLRETDILARYGGDEFSIIMPNASLGESMTIAERIRKNIEEKFFAPTEGETTNLTVSIGIASFPSDSGSSSPEKLVECADLALYKAKMRGRNKVCLYNELSDNESHDKIEEFEEFKKRIRSFSSDIKERAYESILSFLRASEKIDPYLLRHSEDVNRYAGMLAKKIGLSDNEAELIKFASLLHDIGKLGISKKIINKDGKLTDDEFRDIKKHPIFSMEILRNVMLFEKEIPLVLYHHENYDGSGYPTGIKGKKIPVGARIIYIADSYAAMTTDRTYQKAMKSEDARKELLRYANVRYDPVYVDTFLRLLDN